MKRIKYKLNYRTNTGTEQEPVWQEAPGPECSMPYSEDNLSIARAEAYGEVTVVLDDRELETIRAELIAAMSTACNAAITGGVDVTLGDGNTYHYSLTAEDQINLISLQSMVAAGADAVPYHADGEACRYYSAADFTAIAQAATAWVLYHQSYFNSLKQYILSAETPEELDAVTYGMEIPDAYRTEVLAQIMSQMECA